MPTLNLQVNASANDAEQSGGVGTSLTGSFVRLGDTGQVAGSMWGAFRFTGVTIGQGVTINSAILKVTSQDTYTGPTSMVCNVYAEDVDNSAAFTTGANNISGRARTTASTTFDIHIAALDVEYSVNITALVQEVINRAGWVSGNALSILIDDGTSPANEWNQYWSYDGSTTKAAKLELDYGSSGVLVTPSPVTLVAASVAPTVIHGSLTLAPAALSAVMVNAGPTVVLGSLTLAPAVSSAVFATVNPTVVGGDLVITPTPISMVMGEVAPTVILSSTIAAPASISAIFNTQNPVVSISGLEQTLVQPDTTILNTTTNIQIGAAYTDVSPKQIFRTSDNRLYMVGSNCDSYPCDALTQTLRVWRADQTGIPSTFTRQDSANEPAAVATVGGAIDGNGDLHLLWTARSASNNLKYLRYCVFDTSAGTFGTVETIASDLDYDDAGQGDQTCAIALDTNGVPHIVYLKPLSTIRRIYYRNRIGGTWSAGELVDDQSFSGNQKVWHPNIALDVNGRIVTFWLRGSFNGDNDGTIFCRVKDGSWQTTVNVSGTNAARVIIDQTTGTMITSENRYHFAFITSTNDYVRYCYSDDEGASWTFNNPGSGLQVTHNPSLGPGPGHRIRIYGHDTPVPPPDGHGDDINYFEGDGGGAAWSAFTHLATGTFDSSVNTRWAQYHVALPQYIDIAYWNDAYPNIAYATVEQWEYTQADLVWATVNPTVSIAVAVTPAPASMVTNSPNPTVVMGSTTIEPAVLSMVLANANPTTVLGSLSLTPGALSTILDALPPAVIAGSLSLTPNPVTATWDMVSPGIVLSSMAVTPTPVTTILTSTGPQVFSGGLFIEPAVVSIVMASTDPVPVLGSLTLTPSPVSAILERVSPDVVLGSSAATPIPASLILGSADPIIGEPEDGEGWSVWIGRLVRTLPGV